MMTNTPAFRAAEERHLSPPEPPARTEEDENPPTKTTVEMHHAIQLSRCVIMAVINDEKQSIYLKGRAGMALRSCDKAMIRADEEFPNFDFYSEDS